MHDAWHDMTHLDGRLWHTLYLLLARPGQLTVDYFEDRRARYMPPVRLYLVLSLLFFALGGANSVAISHKPHVELHGPASITAPAAPSAATSPAPSGSPASTPPEVAPSTGSAAASPLSSAASSAADDDDKDDDAGASTDAKNDDWGLPCEKLPPSEGSIAIRGADTICRHFNAQDPNEFIKALLHNIPKMMFVFLPLLAAVMLLLYWRPRRYYVEHLVFILHNHSALFAAFLLVKLVGLVTKVWHPLNTIAVIAGFALFLYTLWYPYKAMRRYYRQRRALTISKYMLIACAYFSCLLLTFVGVAIVTALEG